MASFKNFFAMRNLFLVLLVIVFAASCRNNASNNNQASQQEASEVIEDYSFEKQLTTLEKLVQTVNDSMPSANAWIVDDVIPTPEMSHDGIGMEFADGVVTNWMNDIKLPHFKTVIYEVEVEGTMYHSVIIVYSNEEGDAGMFHSPQAEGKFVGVIHEPLHVGNFQAGNFTFSHLSF